MEKKPSSTPDKSTTLLNQAKAMAAQGNKVVAVALLSQYIACTPEKKQKKLIACAVTCSCKWETNGERKKMPKRCYASIHHWQTAIFSSTKY